MNKMEMTSFFFDNEYMLYLMRLFGTIGLILITTAIFAKKEKKQDWLFVWGGLGLLMYSISLKDPIFIPLQVIFIGASLYEIYTLRNKKS